MIDNNSLSGGIDDLIIEISPNDMAAGTDPETGLPITVPVDKPNGKAPGGIVAKPKDRVPTLAELDQAKRETASERTRREAAESDARTRSKEAQEAQEQLAALQPRVTEAERQRDVRTVQAYGAHYERTRSEFQRLEDGIGSAEALAQSIVGEIKNASEAGNHEQIAKLQRELSRAEAQLVYLQGAKTNASYTLKEAEDTYRDLLAGKAPAKQAADPPEPPEKVKAKEKEPDKQATVTPEQWIEGVRGVAGDEVVSWLNEHKEYASGKPNRTLIRFADQWADDHGVENLKSADFLAALKAKFSPEPNEGDDVSDNDNQEGEAEVQEPAPQQQTQRRAAPSAPVSRTSSPGKPGGGPEKITLTQDQYAIAPDIYGSFEELSPEAQAKFKTWSPQAARWQYDKDLKRAKKDKPHRFT